MSGALYNLAMMTVASSGTGTITLSSAATQNGVTFLDFNGAGVPTGQSVYYSILDPGGGGASEMSLGTYTSSNLQVTRGPITTTNGGAAINMSRQALVLISPPTSQFIEALSSNRTYYVRVDGADANTGFVNSSGGAFLTWTKAVSTLQQINFNSFTVTATNGTSSGVYTTGFSMQSPWIGSGSLVFDLGGGSIIGATGSAIVISNCSLPGQVTVQNGTIASSVASGVIFSANGTLNFSSGATGLTFGACTNEQIACSFAGSFINATGVSYNISGGGTSHVKASNGGIIQIALATATFTSTGTVAYSSATGFAYATAGGQIIAGLGTYGTSLGATVTGSRYRAQLGGGIDPNATTLAASGTLLTYFPGSIAGTGTNYGVTPWGLYNG